MKEILVTGGAGFIGSHLVDYLLKRGDRVTVIDDFSTGSRKNLSHLSSNDRLILVEGDITEPFKIAQKKFDELYNLACPASPVHYQANPLRTIKINTIGVMNAIAFAKATGARFLQASTSEIYGDPLIHPQVETYWGNVNPIGPRACYDEGKRIAEALCFEHHRTNGITIRVARIFNTYGPRMAANDGRVVSNFIVQALSGADITIEGDGAQTRSFCYVSDMVKGLVSLMESNDIGPVNLGNPDERTVRELAEKILSLTGSQSKIVKIPPAPDGPMRRKPDISLAKKTLHWEPTVPLDEGLRATIADFKARQ